jgi:hypothetical protein
LGTTKVDNAFVRDISYFAGFSVGDIGLFVGFNVGDIGLFVGFNVGDVHCGNSVEQRRHIPIIMTVFFFFFVGVFEFVYGSAVASATILKITKLRNCI